MAGRVVLSQTRRQAETEAISPSGWVIVPPTASLEKSRSKVSAGNPPRGMVVELVPVPMPVLVMNPLKLSGVPVVMTLPLGSTRLPWPWRRPLGTWCASRACRTDPGRLTPSPGTGWKGPPFTKTRAVKGHEFGLDLSPEDKAALIAFLKTL